MSKTLRRSARFQNRPNPINYAESKSLKEYKIKQKEDCDGYLNFENDKFKEELQNIEQSIEKPTELFLQCDVDGKDIYRVIRTPIKKNAMIEKAKMSRNSKSTISPIKKDLRICLTKVATNNKSDKLWNIKSNSLVKKNKINTKRKNLNSSEEYHTSSSDNETNSDMSENENSQCSDNEDEKKSKYVPEEIVADNSRRVLRPRINKGYHLKTDEYFTVQSEKSVTSNHTLSKLKNRHIDEEKLQELLANNNYISKVHQEQIQLISETLQMHYTEWFHIMEEGFSVLLYGLGSKRFLINNFRKEMIPDEAALVINGFFPSLTIKEILDNIIVELLGLSTVTNQSECFDIIEKTMKAHPSDNIYLLIHNIDGGILRSSKAQDMLSRLASIPNIHLLASIDHINAPLLWDNVKRARYNFYWMDTTTFLPYEAETSYESSLLVQKSGALALLSLQNVFASLTSNAKAIYTVLAKHQIENNGNNYAGMAFKDLYRASREGFLVSSDQTLRAQLTEFIDHKLVKIKRQIDGVEYLIIPLDDALLKQFLEQQNQMD